jgi:hypothetical protein
MSLSHTQAAVHPSRRQRTGIAMLLALASLGAGGCASRAPEPSLRGALLHTSWLLLQGETSAEVSPGLVMQLPQAPYRAKFADAQGVFYQASMPLVFRTQQGSVVSVAGGLYVKHARPHEALSWTEPVWLRPAMVYPVPFAVRRYPGH